MLYISARRIDWSQNYVVMAIRFANLPIKAGELGRPPFIKIKYIEG